MLNRDIAAFPFVMQQLECLFSHICAMQEYR